MAEEKLAQARPEMGKPGRRSPGVGEVVVMLEVQGEIFPVGADEVGDEGKV